LDLIPSKTKPKKKKKGKNYLGDVAQWCSAWLACTKPQHCKKNNNNLQLVFQIFVSFYSLMHKVNRSQAALMYGILDPISPLSFCDDLL
jgi:hypothetical protein